MCIQCCSPAIENLTVDNVLINRISATLGARDSSLLFQLLPALCRNIHTIGYENQFSNVSSSVSYMPTCCADRLSHEWTDQEMSFTCVYVWHESCPRKISGKISLFFQIQKTKWREMLQSSIYLFRMPSRQSTGLQPYALYVYLIMLFSIVNALVRC